MDLAFLNTQLGAALIGAIAGILLATFVQIYFRRRGLCTYPVTHNRAAVSADDPVFGSLRVTWQGTEVSNLYVSTAELRNESINDYENVKVRLYTNNTTLLNERTQVLGSPDALKWTDDYRQQIAPDNLGNVSNIQRGIYWGQREYLVPVLNRGEKIQFEYVSIAKDINKQPEIWMSINHKGLVLRGGPIRLNSSLSFFSGVSADAPAASLPVGSITAYASSGVCLPRLECGLDWLYQSM